MNATRLRQPGCMSKAQITALKAALETADRTPSLLCDLEGAGAVAELEEDFAEVCGAPYALALSSGTAAIHAALLAAGVGFGDEVIVTPYSWSQSVSPVLFCGGIPVFADIDARTLNLDPTSVRRKITSKTKAIIAVHLFGNPADMPALLEIAEKCGAVLITDAAHGLGARLHARRVGAWGHAACFSLGRGKLVSGGEGGVMVTADAGLYENALALTQHPERLRRMAGPGAVPGFGLNYRMHPLSALMAICDLNQMDDRLAHRREILAAVALVLDGCAAFTMPSVLESSEPAAYGVALGLAKGYSREAIVSKARAAGIPLRCGPVCQPLHLVLDKDVRWSRIAAETCLPGSCPAAEERCRDSELWLLSALDMDAISVSEAESMAETLRHVAE